MAVLKITDFQQFLLLRGCGGLEITDNVTVFMLGGCGDGLERTANL